MFKKLLEQKEEILNEWLKNIEIELDESELKYQFSKLYDAVIAKIKGENINEHLDDFVEDMSKYEISPQEITKSLENLIYLIERSDFGLDEREILMLNKFIYSLALGIYEEFEKKRLDIIQKQLKTIKKMEIPILKLNKETILVPLIGFMDSEKALNLMRNILETIRKEEILRVIIDIEGVPVIDTEVANQFVRIYRGIKAIGAKMVMSGITPAVAETMVHLEIDLPIPTRANLELAIKAFDDEEI
ncbi:STAS domain-containing protein [Caminibacter sp.]